MTKRCQACGRQLVSMVTSEMSMVGGGPVTLMFGGLCCHECSRELDENGLFPEEKMKLENEGETDETSLDTDMSDRSRSRASCTDREHLRRGIGSRPDGVLHDDGVSGVAVADE